MGKEIVPAAVIPEKKKSIGKRIRLDMDEDKRDEDSCSSNQPESILFQAGGFFSSPGRSLHRWSRMEMSRGRESKVGLWTAVTFSFHPLRIIGSLFL